MSKPIEASIVVVDDEPSIRELLVASLHFAGFDVPPPHRAPKPSR